MTKHFNPTHGFISKIFFKVISKVILRTWFEAEYEQYLVSSFKSLYKSVVLNLEIHGLLGILEGFWMAMRKSVS